MGNDQERIRKKVRLLLAAVVADEEDTADVGDAAEQVSTAVAFGGDEEGGDDLRENAEVDSVLGIDPRGNCLRLERVDLEKRTDVCPCPLSANSSQ